MSVFYACLLVVYVIAFFLAFLWIFERSGAKLSPPRRWFCWNNFCCQVVWRLSAQHPAPRRPTRAVTKQIHLTNGKRRDFWGGRQRNSKRNRKRRLWSYWKALGTRGRGEIKDSSFQFLVLDEFFCTFPFFVLP